MHSQFAIRKTLVLVAVVSLLAGCASRGPRAPVSVTSTEVSLEEQKARELTSIWQGDLITYLERDEGDWPTRLSQLRDIQSRRGLRPGRICFSTLAAGGDPDSGDAMDVIGLLQGQQVFDGRNWFLFIVGIVQREDFRPVEVRDIRLMAFAADGNEPLWRSGEPNADALSRYKEAYKTNIPVRFPADDDSYQYRTEGEQVIVRELRSGGEWTIW